MNYRFLAAAFLSLGIASAAHADSITFNLTNDLSSGTNLGTPTGLGTGVFAQVVFTQDGANVDVTETLATGYRYVNTGAGESLMFNLTGNPTLTVSNLSSNFTFNQTDTTVGNSSFHYFVECTGCGSGGSSPVSSPLTFTIDNVTLAGLNFAPAGGHTKSGYYFITDVIAPGENGPTGDVGGNTPGMTTTAATPEPSSLTLFGTGILGLAGVLRRKCVAG